MTTVLVSRGARLRPISAALIAIGLVAGCGGGGDTSTSGPIAIRGQMQPSSAFAAQCMAPRPAGTIIDTQDNLSNDRQGSASTEKSWVRSWIDETYLWYSEVPPSLDVASYSNAVSYFDVLKTPAITASGKDKDQFHFTYDTPEWIALAKSGVSLGYGIEFAAISTRPPRRLVVAFTEPGAQAATSNVTRGDELITVDGLDFVNTNDLDQIAALNNALSPSSPASSHTFTFRTLGGATRTVTLTPADITRTPVRNVKVLTTATGKVGYLQFNDHIATSEVQLIDAINQLNAGGPLTDLVLDIRYNGGGYLDIASQLAYMIAGNTRTAGKTFERLSFNDKNPFGTVTTPFHTTTLGFLPSTDAGRALPTLGLNRVFVLAGAGTCSASEAIINGLRGIDVQVVQIGATTCGKPYGFFPAENCGTTYFAIQFQGVNHKGFGDYADGFVPASGAANGVPGCLVADDFTHALGDVAEARLAAALGYRATGTCPPATSTSREAALALRSSPEPTMLRNALRENRFYRQR